jgi:hypothetical protein
MTTSAYLAGYLLVLPILAIVRDAIASHTSHKEALRRTTIQYVMDQDWDNVHIVDHTADGAVIEIVARRRETVDRTQDRAT